MKTQIYEGMFIIHTGNDEESSRNEVLEEIKSELKRQDASIESIVELGKKTFTYAIKKQKDGYYYLIYMNINPQAISKLLARFKLNGHILRQLIIKIDEIPKPEDRKIGHKEDKYSPESEISVDSEKVSPAKEETVVPEEKPAVPQEPEPAPAAETTESEAPAEDVQAEVKAEEDDVKTSGSAE